MSFHCFSPFSLLLYFLLSIKSSVSLLSLFPSLPLSLCLCLSFLSLHPVSFSVFHSFSPLSLCLSLCVFLPLFLSHSSVPIFSHVSFPSVSLLHFSHLSLPLCLSTIAPLYFSPCVSPPMLLPLFRPLCLTSDVSPIYSISPLSLPSVYPILPSSSLSFSIPGLLSLSRLLPLSLSLRLFFYFFPLCLFTLYLPLSFPLSFLCFSHLSLLHLFLCISRSVLYEISSDYRNNHN
jgi:hypothetical protein